MVFKQGLVRGRATWDEDNRRAVDEDLLRTIKVVRSQHLIGDWTKQLPQADSYVNDWQNSRAESMLMAALAARTWTEHPNHSEYVRNYWKDHRDQFPVLKSASWQQATVSNETADDFQRRLEMGSDWGSLIQKYSTDRYHLRGGKVESNFPHLLTPEPVIRSLKTAKPDQRTHCVIGDETTFLLVKSLEIVPGEFVEVVGDVKTELARLKCNDIAKKLCEKKRTECRIERTILVRK